MIYFSISLSLKFMQHKNLKIVNFVYYGKLVQSYVRFSRICKGIIVWWFHEGKQMLGNLI